MNFLFPSRNDKFHNTQFNMGEALNYFFAHGVDRALQAVIIFAREAVRARMKCPYCKTKNNSMALHCRKCGKKLPSTRDGREIN